MIKKVGVVKYPCSNCFDDCIDLAKQSFYNIDILAIDFRESSTETLKGIDILIIPGGFSFGDAVSAGVIASYQPVSRIIRAAARDLSITTLGICNGFQILTELDLLPGKLYVNECGKFISKDVRIYSNTGNMVFRMPIANMMGRFVPNEDFRIEDEEDKRLIVRYVNESYSGSTHDIAGISNHSLNVFGLMPHPDRAINGFRNGSDGIEFIRFISRIRNYKKW